MKHDYRDCMDKDKSQTDALIVRQKPADVPKN